MIMFLFPKTMNVFFFPLVNAEEDKKDTVLKCSFADLSDFCLGKSISSISLFLYPLSKGKLSSSNAEYYFLRKKKFGL